MNREEIMELLPHRDSMLLLDEAELLDGKAHGKKKINGTEWFLDGHFPGHPVVPGDTFETYCEITKARPPFYFAKGEGFVDGKKCVSAEFSFVVQNQSAEA